MAHSVHCRCNVSYVTMPTTRIRQCAPLVTLSAQTFDCHYGYSKFVRQVPCTALAWLGISEHLQQYVPGTRVSAVSMVMDLQCMGCADDLAVGSGFSRCSCAELSSNRSSTGRSAWQYSCHPGFVRKTYVSPRAPPEHDLATDCA
jgi:hypothetical protein